MAVETVVQDIRCAMRELRSAPTFSTVAILTLAVGIGSAIALFSAVNATLLRPLPYPNADALVDVRTRFADGRPTSGFVSIAEIDALSRATTVVGHASGVGGRAFDASLVLDDGTAMPIAVSGVTAGFFETMGLPMTLGRAFAPDEHGPGLNADLVIISHHLWESAFDSAPDIVGRPVRLAELFRDATVIGVASADLDLPRGTDAWTNERLADSGQAHVMSGLVRLRPGASLAELHAAGAQAMAEVIRTDPSQEGRELVFEPLLRSAVGDVGPILLIALGATTLLLVLATVNVANLMAARGMARTHDMALRSALGASRGRLIRQLVTEAMVMSVAGAFAGGVLAYAAVRAFMAAGGAELPRLDRVPLDWRVAAFAIGATALAGLVSGLVPAMRLARTDVRALLAEGTQRQTAGRGISQLMSGMVVVEVALAIALVAGGGWLIQSYATLSSRALGFHSNGQLVVDVRSIHPVRTAIEAEAWLQEVLRRVRTASPGAQVGAAWDYPLRPDRSGVTGIEIAGDASAGGDPRSVHAHVISQGLIEAMGIDLVAGRTFTVDDRRDSEPVILVNRSFVRQFLGGRDPLLTQVAIGFPTVDWSRPARIVGVVDDVRYEAPGLEPDPAFYGPTTQRGYPTVQQTVVVSAADRDLTTVVASIRAELERFDPQLVLAFTPATEIVGSATKYERLGMALMTAFGAAALLLAAIGVYGVIASVASTRRSEIATRMALGATRPQVLGLMIGSARRLSLFGGVLGVWLAYACGRVLAGNVFGVSAVDARVLGGSALAVLAVVLVATLVPAVKASREDPLRALRAE